MAACVAIYPICPMERKTYVTPGVVKVSVCVPVYGVENYIERCARSLFSQTMTGGVEFIFVDDASPDGSVARLQRVIDEYGHLRVRIIHHEKNLGLPAARRTAVRAAVGEYVAHVDSDDYVAPTYISSLLGEAARSKADVVECGYQECGGSCRSVVPRVGREMEPVPLAIWNGERDGHVWAKLIRRDVYVRHPECLTPDDVVIKEDLYAMVRIAFFANRIAVVPSVLYFYNCANPWSLLHTGREGRISSLVPLWRRTVTFLRSAYPDGQYEGDIMRAVIDGKAEWMLYSHDVAAKRRWAHLYHDEEMPYVRQMGRGLRFMATMVHYGVWPIVWLHTQYAHMLEWLARRRK